MKKKNFLLWTFLISLLLTNIQGQCQFDSAFYAEKVERWDTNGYIKFYPEEVSAGEMFTVYSENFLYDTSKKMVIIDTTYDSDLDMYSYHYEQYYLNIPVEGTHLTELVFDGSVIYASMVLCPGIYGSAEPEGLIAEGNAIDSIMAYYSNRELAWTDTSWENSLKRDFGDTNVTYYPTGELTWALDNYVDIGFIIDSNRYTLCYKFEIYLSDTFQHLTVYVNAYDGSIHNIIEPTDFFTGSAETFDYDAREIDIKEKSNVYYLISKEDGRDIETRYYADKWQDCAVPTSVNSDWGTSFQLATSAHIYACKAWDYFEEYHDRNGLNDKGKELRVRVNYQVGTGASFRHQKYLIAFYHDYINVGYDATNTSSSGARRVCIDVLGHEFMEGIIEYTVNLYNEGEAIAVKQSICDMFGFMVEWYMDENNFDWTIGEDGITRRIMNDPYSMNFPKKWHDNSQYGDWLYEDNEMTNSKWNEYGHVNSVPMSYWFYLIANPGDGYWVDPPARTQWIKGIGFENAAKLVYKVINAKHIPQSANYWQMWNATRDMAEALWGKCSPTNDNYHNVMQAWKYIDVQLGSGCDKAFIEQQDENNSPSVFYNSKDRTLTILSDDNILTLNIYDLNGKIVEQKTDNIAITDLATLPNGVYIVSIKTEKRIFNSKVIIIQ